jgi:membrane-bound serine protease (ClpP class)
LPGVQPDGDKKATEPTTEESKATNDAVAFLRGLAQLHGRDAAFAEKAVREAATLTADEALKQHVVEIIAPSIDDLLTQASGRSIKVGNVEQRLEIKNATVETVEPDWRTRLLGVIADPNIAYILLLIGIYGLLLEFLTPGMFAPGVIGAISLILALIALSTLPV